MVKVKICGNRTAKDIEYLNELKPDYAGFILTAGFGRSIGKDTALVLTKALSDDIKTVGVFVDETADTVNTLARELKLDYVQLHGNESPGECEKIVFPVIKALKPDSFGRVREYENTVEFFLFDAGYGDGAAFDRSLVPETVKPFFLAGGLNAENVTQAISETNPFAADVSSGVETDGAKDYNKIKKFINTVRSYENE
jgi:phosphoribosylanthranilate isomerase